MVTQRTREKGRRSRPTQRIYKKSTVFTRFSRKKQTNNKAWRDTTKELQQWLAKVKIVNGHGDGR